MWGWIFILYEKDLWKLSRKTEISVKKGKESFTWEPRGLNLFVLEEGEEKMKKGSRPSVIKDVGWPSGGDKKSRVLSLISRALSKTKKKNN